MAEKKLLIVITGPTASGKSALAVDVARRLGTEIVSADSRQVYADIPISTAAPTAEELAAVPHHLVGHLGLREQYSAARFEAEALAELDKIFGRRDVAVVCGGSMMYVDALCDGMDDLPDVDPALRRQVVDDHRRYGDAWLRLRLYALDPLTYSRIDLMNMKRIRHAVELSMQAGCPYSELLGKAGRAVRPFEILKFRTVMERPALFDRINRRVEMMMDQGLEAEARRVYPLRELNSLNTVGLKEMFEMFDGRWDLPTALARIAKNTRVYAKKQMTWLQRDDRHIEVDMSDPARAAATIAGMAQKS